MKNPIFNLISDHPKIVTNSKTTKTGKQYLVIDIPDKAKRIKLNAGEFCAMLPHITVFEEQATHEQQHTHYSCYHYTSTLQSVSNHERYSVRVYFDRR